MLSCKVLAPVVLEIVVQIRQGLVLVGQVLGQVSVLKVEAGGGFELKLSAGGTGKHRRTYGRRVAELSAQGNRRIGCGCYYGLITGFAGLLPKMLPIGYKIIDRRYSP